MWLKCFLLLYNIEGEDYEDFSTEVTIRLGDERRCVHVGVSILEDGDVEQDETFQVIVENLGISSTVAILDDGIIMCTGRLVYTVDELKFCFADLTFRFVSNSPVVRENRVDFSLEFGRLVTAAECAIEANAFKDCE